MEKMSKKGIYFQPTPSIREEEKHTPYMISKSERKQKHFQEMRDDTECYKIDL